MQNFFIWLLLVTVAGSAQAQQKVLVGMGNFEPYYVAQGHTGIFADIIKAAFRELPDYQLQFDYGYTNNQLWGAFAGGRLDAVTNLFDSVELEACRSDPVFRFRDVAISRTESAFDVDSVADLRGRSIVTFEGANRFFGPAFGQVIDPQRYQEIGKPKLQVRMLLSGRSEVSVGDLYIFLAARQELASAGKLGDSPAIAIHDIFPQIYSRMGFRDPALCSAFNSALAKVRASGEYEAIYQRYMNRYLN